MTGESAVTSINERSTYSRILFKFGFVPSTKNLRNERYMVVAKIAFTGVI